MITPSPEHVIDANKEHFHFVCRPVYLTYIHHFLDKLIMNFKIACHVTIAILLHIIVLIN